VCESLLVYTCLLMTLFIYDATVSALFVENGQFSKCRSHLAAEHWDTCCITTLDLLIESKRIELAVTNIIGRAFSLVKVEESVYFAV